MNTIEDRLRDALRERAAHSPIDPDAWARTVARTGSQRGRGRGRAPGWSRFMIPAAAAAAVVAIIVGAAALTGHGGPRGGGAAGSTRPATQNASPGQEPGPNPLFSWVPPRSGVVSLHYAPPGNTAKYYPAGTDRGTVTATFYTGYRSKAYWFPNISTGRQLCMYSWHTYSVQPGPGHTQTWGNQALECEPTPTLAPGQLVRVTSGTDPGTHEGTGAFAADVMRQGIAARQVASVTAVLPDGRSYPGAVGSARGLGENVWSVMYPAAGAVRLVFRDAAGREVASQTRPANPGVPMQGDAARPSTGGVRLAGGAMTAYLIDGHVAFWPRDTGFPAVFSPYRASGAPALGAVAGYDESANVGSLPGLKNRAEFGYFGYAQAGVTRVMLRVQGLTGFTTIDVPTVAVSWPGASVRLWSAQQPWNASPGEQGDTATAYDAAGHVVAVVQIGSWAS